MVFVYATWHVTVTGYLGKSDVKSFRLLQQRWALNNKKNRQFGSFNLLFAK